MERKGQAAMEFLMTYGWAILAAIIAIAVLAYFGVFSPAKYMPETCTLAPPLSCKEHQILASDAVRLIILNSAGDSIVVDNIEIEGCTAVGGVAIGSPAGDVGDGGEYDAGVAGITCTVTPGSALNAGDKFKGDITVKYTKTGATIQQISTGTVNGKAA